MIYFYEYPKCTTCMRAKKFLRENNIEFEEISLKENTPNKETLKKVLGGMSLKRLFNTSGKSYRDLNLKEKFNDLSLEDALEMLSNDGALLKRPIYIDDDNDIYLIGYKEKEWNKIIK